jgi:hypothetical protein
MKLEKKLFGPVLALSLSLTGLAAWAYQFGGGSRNIDATRNQMKIQVYNADNVAHEVGDVVVWTDGSVSDGVEVTTTTTANNSLVAGVVVDADIPAASWGWIQTMGYHATVTVTGTVTAGDQICTSTTGEAARAYTIADSTGTAAGQGEDNGVFGVALTSDSGGTVKAFIHR